ncbi:MAG: hypothetical protein E7676_01440 [Ruminococcaceae bacterium]|nr:hypothetical protein [Oscillospiraceae bacterium]
MNAVVFYSATGQSELIAKYFAKKLCYPVLNIENIEDRRYESLVLVFPVHCQNIPYVVEDFLKTAEVEHLTAVATYGKMCPGNVLYEIKKEFGFNIVAGAYIPTKHSYVDGDVGFADFDKLEPIFEKIKNPSPIELPRLYKNPLANLFPRLRSRFGLKIYKDSNCKSCGICDENCHFEAIKDGVTNYKCIRCLKCVKACPQGALHFKARLPLRIYLKKRQINKTIVYI